MKSQYKDRSYVLGGSPRLSDGSIKIGALLRRGWIRAVLAATVMVALPPAVHAQQSIAFTTPVHSATVSVILGKTQDVRTDQGLADITVGDPDIADVSPLTDHSLSILGKRIGTTRVTVYSADKKPIGIFDIEVTYDTSRLAIEFAQFTGGGIKVSSINGRIMLSGIAPDAVTLDKAVQIARQFGPDPINTVQVAQAQQIMLEVRFIEVDRNAGRDLGVQWNAFGNGVLANTGSDCPLRSCRSRSRAVRSSSREPPSAAQCPGEPAADFAGGRRRRPVHRRAAVRLPDRSALEQASDRGQCP